MILAADIGTTTIKAALIDNNGIVSTARVSGLSFSDDYTVDTSVWENSLKKTFSELGCSVRKADCIIISGNGPTLTPSCGGKAFLWLNRQAVRESEEIFKTTGLSIDPSFFLPKALFIKNNFPDIYKKADFFMSSPEYISYRLTGIARTIMPLEGLEKWYWNDNLLSEFKLDSNKFPKFIKPGEFLGTVSSEASITFGLQTGTPVLAGCPDFMGAIIGSGAMHPGQICDRTGTSEGINCCSAKPNSNPNLMCYRHPNGQSWNVSGIISTTGKAVEFIHGLCKTKDSLTEFVSKTMEKSTPGSKGIMFHPYLTGERAPLWDVNVRASFTGLGLDSSKYDIARSVLEGVNFAVRHVLTLFDEVSELRIVGTPAMFDSMNQMKADITGMKVTTIEEHESDLLGLGILAISCLEKRDIVSVCDSMIKPQRTFEPNPQTRQMYDSLFERYISYIP